MDSHDMKSDDIKCVWPKTEVNHDFGTHKLFTPSTLNNFNSFFNTALYIDVGTCSQPESVQYGRNKPLINDEDIVKTIFGHEHGKDYFKDLTYSRWETIQVKCKSSAGKVEHKNINFLKIKKKDNSKEYNELLTTDINIFEKCKNTDDNRFDVFFIQDVADAELLRQLKHTYNEQFSKKYYIHVINSVETIGDSASKILPDCKKMYCYKNKPHSTCNTRLFSWLNTNNRTLTTDEYDEFMKTNYIITTSYDQQSNIKKRLIINQNWTKPGVAGEFYYDINQKNNRTTIIDEVKEELQNEDKNKEKISRAFQRKRSGDYLQIYFAKKFPYLNNEEFKLILPDQKQLDILKSQESQSESESLPNKWQYPDAYQDKLINVEPANKIQNTFIVTNDWPCLAYAIYNKVNVILHNNSPTCRYLLVFQFTT